MKARTILPGAVLVLLLAVASPASGGGGTWLLNGDPSAFAAFSPGQQIEATATLWLESVRENGSNGDFHGGPQHGPFFGWLVRSRPGSYPVPLPEDALYVGDVVFLETDHQKVMDVSLSFRMPDLEPGNYEIVACNDGCERQIADIMATGFTVMEDPGQAVLASRVARLDHRLMVTRMRLKDKGTDLQRIQNSFEHEVDLLRNRIDDLEAQPIAIEEPSPAPIGTWPVVATAVFVALAIIMVFGARGKQASLEI